MSYRERFIHSEIDRARADVMSVVHCHTPSLLPFADTDVPMVARAVHLDVRMVESERVQPCVGAVEAQALNQVDRGATHTDPA